MKNQRIDIASIRREQIVEAAVAVIAEQGLQNLSLSAIEKKAGMSRGQLTYYFPATEDILLAVLDRMIATMHRRAQEGNASHGRVPAGTRRHHGPALLGFLRRNPRDAPPPHALHYTF